ATIAKDFINELDTSGRAIIFEDQARNTFENAVFTRGLVGPKPGEHWILVCQAIAMPRAVGVFRKAGWDVIPFPAGYLTAGRDRAFLSFDLTGGFRLATLALHEWVGLIVYRMMGYSDALYPE
ncbi:MAG: YdcF family protein, partial [Alphaproteobacteria bacterium]